VLLAYTMGIYLAIGPIDPSQAPPFALPGLVAINDVPGPELAPNGGDFHQGLTGYQTFWTNVLPGWTITSGPAGQATARTDGTGANVARVGLNVPIPVVPGQRYRITSRVRAGVAGHADLDLITGATAADADWFGSGSIIQGRLVPVSPLGRWLPFTYEATVPAGHHFMQAYWSVLFDNPANPGTMELDDVSLHLLTQDVRLDLISEGMTATYRSDYGWALEVAVSARSQGWAVISWQDLNGAATANTRWLDVDPALMWKDVSDVSQFGG
jgi:hypothetical protein